MGNPSNPLSLTGLEAFLNQYQFIWLIHLADSSAHTGKFHTLTDTSCEEKMICVFLLLNLLCSKSTFHHPVEKEVVLMFGPTGESL